MKHIKLFEQFLNEARTSASTIHLKDGEKIEHQPGVKTVYGGGFEVKDRNPMTKGSYLLIRVSKTWGKQRGADLFGTDGQRIPLCVWMLSETSESIIELILDGETIGNVKIDRNNYKATAKKMWKLSLPYMTHDTTETDYIDILKLWIDLTDEFPRK